MNLFEYYTFYLLPRAPGMNTWRRKTAIQVKNIPSNADEEEIMLRFEGRSYWGRELDVKQVVPVESSDVTYVIFNDEQGGFGSSKLSYYCSYYYLFGKLSSP